MEVVSKTIRESLGLPEHGSNEFYKVYLPELKIEEITPDTNKCLYKEYRALKQILNDISELVRFCGFGTTTVFFDKIDEYTLLDSSIKNVASFLESFLRDTTVLMNENYALVFSIWDVVKPELAHKGVRFDKIKPVDITWNSDELKGILNKRVKYFSNSSKSISDLITDDQSIDSIINLASNSPRHMFRILSYIYDVQSNDTNVNTLSFSKEAIKGGQSIYASSFDFYSIYPTSRGSSKDIMLIVNKLLKLNKINFTTRDFQKGLQLQYEGASSNIKTAQDYDLIKEVPNARSTKTYKVKDPIIRHLITIGVKEMQQ
ncbi:hypothetical protein [Hymenobacter lucidus]|uniref:Uncharacterized protein n=1 Tax=Hymenobacter lucidus TaxID=2880930 RepID=A0ABS8AW91_9BACT|nr:hypothetical protein [Hymenobacter lucidus]MCB2409746.1 hypothetical protein [Hymenobacter lucidus]